MGELDGSGPTTPAPVVVNVSIGSVGFPEMVTRPRDQRNSTGSTWAATCRTVHDPILVAEKLLTTRLYMSPPYAAAPAGCTHAAVWGSIDG